MIANLEGACWLCSRSCLPHPSHACRSCRAGKPDEWRAARPTSVAELVGPILTSSERRSDSWRELSRRTFTKENVMPTTEAEKQEKQETVYDCPCGRRVTGQAIGSHKRYHGNGLAKPSITPTSKPSPKLGGGQAECQTGGEGGGLGFRPVAPRAHRLCSCARRARAAAPRRHARVPQRAVRG